MVAIVSATTLRDNLAEYLDRVSDDRAPLYVTRQGARTVVILDEDEYEGLLETLHLLSSPRNAEELRQAIADADAGIGFVDDETVRGKK